MPDYYFELRRQQADALDAALDVIDEVAADFEQLSGRRLGATEAYRLEDATRAIVALGSTAGTVKDVVDELRDEREPVGLLKLVSFRPFPVAAVEAALGGCWRVAVLDRADSPGGTPPLHAELAAALYGSGLELDGYVYGLGGRDLHPPDVRAVFSGQAAPYVGLRGERCPV
jgi:pyruvate ferredoxin oxidoreductase alpha subunit